MMPAVPLYSPLVEQALRVAARAHHTQQRKGAGEPYVTHVAGVALILARAGFCDERVLAAAILHDVVEDTDVTVADLERAFPPDVVELVAYLTETKLDTNGIKRPWEMRKSEHIEKLREAPVEACAIALADKLHNLETMLLDLASGVIRFEDFGAPAERLIWYYEQIMDAATGSARVGPLSEACDNAIERLRSAAASRDIGERRA
jgi:(p)ppGpp synthase/HD superfamily hydrolase